MPKLNDTDATELKAWQEVVLSLMSCNCQTASQLAVCMNLLDKRIIAWRSQLQNCSVMSVVVGTMSHYCYSVMAEVCLYCCITSS